ALQRQHGEHAFMHSPQRFVRREALQRLVAEGELAQGEIALAGEAARAEPDQIFRRIVLRTINDAQIFAPAHLQGGLTQSLLPPGDEGAGLDAHALAAAGGQRLPPRDGATDRAFVVERDPTPAGWGYDLVAGSSQAVGEAHVPDMILIEPDPP